MSAKGEPTGVYLEFIGTRVRKNPTAFDTSGSETVSEVVLLGRMPSNSVTFRGGGIYTTYKNSPLMVAERAPSGKIRAATKAVAKLAGEWDEVRVRVLRKHTGIEYSVINAVSDYLRSGKIPTEDEVRHMREVISLAENDAEHDTANTVSFDPRDWRSPPAPAGFSMRESVHAQGLSANDADAKIPGLSRSDAVR
jgi:hypothetical protein